MAIRCDPEAMGQLCALHHSLGASLRPKRRRRSLHELRALIERGEYRVDSDRLARKMVRMTLASEACRRLDETDAY